ncbi:MAG: serine/threonine-protein kinase [Gemmatimonadota bacterium]|nr:serine/threonine-protein kinase [Gemmatimonadota bacterium]
MTDRSADDGGSANGLPADAHGALTSDEEFRSAVVARFAIEREIGRGGAGIVFLAHDVTRGERIALKTLRPELAASVGIARFAQEVELGRAMDHPNIVRILDSGTVGGRLYCTMPYVEGKTLRAHLRAKGQLSVDETFDIARQLAAALDYAHTHPSQVVHRDLKPANVLLTGSQALLADFGIARALTTSTAGRLTESGIALGTVEYMSPEQVEARKDVDRRADIYALGCVVFEMLAGEPPFTGPTSQSVQARTLHEAPRSLRIVRPNVSRAADAAIARALAKVPADRFGTAGEFVAALMGPEVPAAPDRAAGQRRRLVTIGVAVAAAFALAVIDASRADSILRRAGLFGALDPQRYTLVLRDTTVATASAATAFRAAFARWQGITVSDSTLVFASAGTRAGAIARTVRSVGASQYIAITTGRRKPSDGARRASVGSVRFSPCSSKRHIVFDGRESGRRDGNDP